MPKVPEERPNHGESNDGVFCFCFFFVLRSRNRGMATGILPYVMADSPRFPKSSGRIRGLTRRRPCQKWSPYVFKCTTTLMPLYMSGKNKDRFGVDAN